ncbi:MAG: hypothetical protein WCG79_11675 [Verrucomicrobiota bacterium]
MTEVAQPRRRGLCFVLAAALLYCIWLGGHWLPLPYSDKELAAFVSRLWDVQTEFAAGHGLTWWTPFYMNGSSYGLNHSQGLYLLPCLLLAKFVSLPAAVKLTSLLAIFAGGWAMYGCARYFIKNEWAAAFAGIEQLLVIAPVWQFDHAAKDPGAELDEFRLAGSDRKRRDQATVRAGDGGGFRSSRLGHDQRRGCGLQLRGDHPSVGTACAARRRTRPRAPALPR